MNQRYENPEGTGAAFFSDNKKNDRAPDWKGKFEWKGETLELSMWERKAKSDNMPYLRFKIAPPFSGGGRRAAPKAEEPAVEGPNDAIPF
jgi:hypothetical protein